MHTLFALDQLEQFFCAPCAQLFNCQTSSESQQNITVWPIPVHTIYTIKTPSFFFINPSHRLSNGIGEIFPVSSICPSIRPTNDYYLPTVSLYVTSRILLPKLPAVPFFGGNLFNGLAEATAGGAWGLLSARTVIRNQFPRARETKRVRVHGWWKRMSTLAGRRVLMRKILKGRHVLSH